MDKRELTTDEVQEVLAKLEAYLQDLKARWDSEGDSGTAWWKIHRSRLVKGTIFIIDCLDELINFVEGFIPKGEDKKAAVMMVVEKLFDYVVYQAFPIWLKPFAPAIKKLVVEVLVGSLIDFFVGKYNTGVWKSEAWTQKHG